jgi:signal transduction histidine kinase
VTEGLVSQQEAWEVVTKQAKRLRDLTNSILDVSKIDSGQLVLHKKEVDINRLVKSVANEKSAGLEGVAIKLKLEDLHGRMLLADEPRILQVLHNLLDNAIKFTKKGTVGVETQLADGDKVAVIIRDAGPGIPGDMLAKLFTKFTSRDVSEMSRNGTGLGLYICKAIIEAHGGTIEGANAKEGGAVFRFVLHAAVPVSAKEPADKNAQHSG